MLRTDPDLRTINFVRERLETDYPRQIEQAERVLGRLTMKYYGQLEFDFGEEDV